jgi:hypothetical protein
MSSLVSYVSSNPAVVFATIAVVAGTIRFLLANKEPKSKSGKNRLRSPSFNSEVLIEGAFPSSVKSNQAVVNAFFTVKKCPEEDVLVEKLKSVLVLDRFRTKVVKINGKWISEDLGSNTDLIRGVIKTYAVQGDDEIRRQVDYLCSQDISYEENLPLWRCYRLVNTSTGKSGILFRFHHFIGDGIAMIGMMKYIFSKLDGSPLSIDIPEKMGGGTSTKGSNLQYLFRCMKSLFEVLTIGMTRFDSDIAFIPNHQQKYFQTSKSRERQTIYFPIFQLEFIKALKVAGKVTINDVILAATTGMIRRYSILKQKDNISNSSSSSFQTRALLPVAFPRPKKDLENPKKALRNLFAMISLPLPINATTPKQRLIETAITTTEAKNSPTAFFQLCVQNFLLANVPAWMARQLGFDAFARHSIVFSNVPGPTETLTLCGEPLLTINVIFPNLLPQFIIISYAQKVYFTLSVDPHEVDGQVLPDLLMEEFQSLAKELGVSTENMVVKEETE